MGVMRNPAGSDGAARNAGRRGTLLVEWIEGEIERAGLAAAEATLHSLLEGPVLPDFLAEVAAYRRRAFPATVTRVLFVKIRNDAVKDRLGHLPVAILNDRAGTAPQVPPNGTPGPPCVVRLSPESAVEQVINHSDLTTGDYRRLPEVIRRGRMLREADGRHLPFFRESDHRHSYKAVVEKTSNEVFLTTFQKIRNSDSPRAERQSTQRTRHNERGHPTIRRIGTTGGARWGLPSGRSRQPHMNCSTP